jgi:hypothetical protein
MENSARHVQIHSLCASLSKIYYLIKSLRNVIIIIIIIIYLFIYLPSVLLHI